MTMSKNWLDHHALSKFLRFSQFSSGLMFSDSTLIRHLRVHTIMQPLAIFKLQNTVNFDRFYMFFCRGVGTHGSMGRFSLLNSCLIRKKKQSHIKCGSFITSPFKVKYIPTPLWHESLIYYFIAHTSLYEWQCILTIMWRNDELIWSMSWVGCLLTD